VIYSKVSTPLNCDVLRCLATVATELGRRNRSSAKIDRGHTFWWVVVLHTCPHDVRKHLARRELIAKILVTPLRRYHSFPKARPSCKGSSGLVVFGVVMERDRIRSPGHPKQGRISRMQAATDRDSSAWAQRAHCGNTRNHADTTSPGEWPWTCRKRASAIPKPPGAAYRRIQLSAAVMTATPRCPKRLSRAATTPTMLAARRGWPPRPRRPKSRRESWRHPTGHRDRQRPHGDPWCRSILDRGGWAWGTVRLERLRGARRVSEG